MMMEEAEAFIIGSKVAKWLPMQSGKEAGTSSGSALPSAPIEAMDDGAATTDNTRVLDLSILAKTVGNDPATIYEIATQFLESAQQDMAKIEAAVENKDLAALAMLGYRLKSSAGAVGALGFADLCQTLAQCEDNGSIELARDIATHLKPLLGQIKEQIDNG